MSTFAAASPPGGNGFIPPLGISKSAAGICAAVFLLGSVLALKDFRMSNRYRMSFLFAMGAATTRRGQAVVYGFFLNAGFGISIAMQALTIGGWFKNTSPAFNLPGASMWRLGAILMVPCVITFGPVIGLAAALLIYVTATPEAIDHGQQLRKAASGGMLGIASLLFLTACIAAAVAARKGPVFGTSGRLAPHSSILVAVVAMALLVWSACVRVASVSGSHPEISTDESLFFPLWILPEMLHVLLWSVHGLQARIHLSNNFTKWWLQSHEDLKSLPLHGMYDDDAGQEQLGGGAAGGREVTNTPHGKVAGAVPV